MSELQALTERLAGVYPTLSPQLRRAAKFVLDAPADVAINSMRTVAGQADVAPSTMLRLAKALAFPSYEAFRRPFRDAMRTRGEGFRDRARWLQAAAEKATSAPLYSQIVAANMANVEHVFATIDPADLERAADLLIGARRTYLIALRGPFSLANYFYYVARMALSNLVLAPRHASSVIDELAEVGADDAVITIGFDPYTRETVKASRFAKERGATLVTITDSRVSPLAIDADHVFIAPTATPQFFPSHVATTALLETLIAYVVSRGGRPVIDSITAYDRLHHQFDVYWRDDDRSPGPDRWSK